MMRPEPFLLSWLALLLVLGSCPQVESSCASRVDEGRPTSITCYANTANCDKNSVALTWYAGGEQVAQCLPAFCGSEYKDDGISASISTSRSLLTIDRVSRAFPFNVSAAWTCETCDGKTAVACDGLPIYAKPESPSCKVTENTESNDFKSVTVSCETDKVFPEPKCSFYRRVNGGNRVEVTGNQVISVSESSSPDGANYYGVTCSVDVSVVDLGIGTHSFQGYIYPDIASGENLVSGITASDTVELTLPESSYSCNEEMVNGHFRSTTARCTCKLDSDGHPSGRAQWKQDGQVTGSSGVLNLVYDKNNPEQVFTCEGVSVLGPNVGETLKARFAFFQASSVQVESSVTTVDLCQSNTPNQDLMLTCRISKLKISPEPTFRFTLNGRVFDDLPSFSEENFYQHQLTVAIPKDGGEYQASCQVHNAVLNTNREDLTPVVIREPPPTPPQVTIEGNVFTGGASTNIVTLAEGYTGQATCIVPGGYPSAKNVRFSCGQVGSANAGNLATLRFTARRDMSQTVCTCTSSHDSSCYNENETRLVLNVIYPPEVTFTQRPTRKLIQGNDLEFRCSAQGNPASTSVTLTMERTNEVVKTAQTAELTHTIRALRCADTDVYVCAGRNSQGTTSQNISVEVFCPQQFTESSTPEPVFDASLGDTVRIGLELYGFPEPTLITLEKMNDATNLASSARHSAVYTPGLAPFGSLYVTISDLVEADFTNYTLTVDNGEEPALSYEFYLKREHTPDLSGSSGSGSSDDGIFIGAGVGGAVLVIIIIVVVVVVVLRRRKKHSDYVNGAAIELDKARDCDPTYVNKVAIAAKAGSDGPPNYPAPPRPTVTHAAPHTTTPGGELYGNSAVLNTGTQPSEGDYGNHQAVRQAAAHTGGQSSDLYDTAAVTGDNSSDQQDNPPSYDEAQSGVGTRNIGLVAEMQRRLQLRNP